LSSGAAIGGKIRQAFEQGPHGAGRRPQIIPVIDKISGNGLLTVGILRPEDASPGADGLHVAFVLDNRTRQFTRRATMQRPFIYPHRAILLLLHRFDHKNSC
jgi:hypothetical protein